MREFKQVREEFCRKHQAFVLFHELFHTEQATPPKWTAEDIDQCAAFFNSPTGRKLKQGMSIIVQKEAEKATVCNAAELPYQARVALGWRLALAWLINLARKPDDGTMDEWQAMISRMSTAQQADESGLTGKGTVGWTEQKVP